MFKDSIEERLARRAEDQDDSLAQEALDYIHCLGDKKQAAKELVKELEKSAVTICFSNGISEKVVSVQAIANIYERLYGK